MNEEDPLLIALWESVESRWDDLEVHASLLNAASEKNNLAFAAAAYRQVKDHGPKEHRDFAEQQLEKITALAFAQIAALKRPPKDHRRILTIIGAIVSILLVSACLYLIQQ